MARREILLSNAVPKQKTDKMSETPLFFAEKVGISEKMSKFAPLFARLCAVSADRGG